MSDPGFARVDALYRECKARFDAGRMDQAAFDKSLDENVFEYAGRYWTIGANTGRCTNAPVARRRDRCQAPRVHAESGDAVRGAAPG